MDDVVALVRQLLPGQDFIIVEVGSVVPTLHMDI
jgi:hypothetical protein